MKFAKELEDDLVPEWRVKYLDYKLGKKKIKAVERALRAAQRTPKWAGGARPGLAPSKKSSSDVPKYPQYDFTQRNKKDPANAKSVPTPIDTNAENQDGQNRSLFRSRSENVFSKSPSSSLAESDDSGRISPDQETTPLNIPNRRPRSSSYGSIIASPPKHDKHDMEAAKSMKSLELPDPALDPNGERHPPDPGHGQSDAFHVGPQSAPRKGSSLPKYLHFKQGERTGSLQEPRHITPVPSKLRRMFSVAGYEEPPKEDVRLEYPYKEVDARQGEFFDFLDSELEKVEDFYQMKEEEATARLQVLRQQLHQLRDQRMEELHKQKHGEQVQQDNGILDELMPDLPKSTGANENGKGNGNTQDGHKTSSFLKPIENMLNRHSHVGKTSKAMGKLGTPSSLQPKVDEHSKDYVRRKVENEHVHYKVAKRKLKLAMQEFYRALELLKSYALLNRTGFRKINKKYDKAVGARPTLRYMNEKVNKAHFVTSNLIENHIVAVEDLYARYFERGNHKVAVGKLRSKLRHGDQSDTTFRNGLYVAAGVALAIDGLVRAAQQLYDSDPTRVTQASYLLQMYAGYFLAVLLFLQFVIDCWIWTETRINYVFIFEFDTRHVLDWRQLAELPCFFLFLNGLCLWLNFREVGGETMYLYWPVVMAGLTLIILALPAPVLYHHARRWWAYSNWRLLLAGLYPVEFRDFFLGDMYCSETYTLSQMEVFFCVYAHDWKNPPQCNSNHSRLLGFFTTLPAIWRALQSLRRYHDSGQWFPHLANFLKYLGNILYYMSLSLYRMNINPQYKAVFITFAAINGVYCSFWDVAMDFSLGNPYAEHPFLRDQLGYRQVWVYYAAAIADVILRHQWIFYAIFVEDLQHAAALSFFVGLAEVIRRGLWALFRVENEHCNNVGKFRASRDIPLPYEIPDRPESGDSHDGPLGSKPLRADHHGISSGHDLEQQNGKQTTPGSLRQRVTPKSTPGIRALQRVGSTIATAHAADYERRRRPEVEGDSPHSMHQLHEESDEDEDGHDPEQADGEEQEEIMLAQRLISRGEG